MIAISLYEPVLKTEGNAEFVAAHKAKYKSEPGYYAAFSYQGATVLERAVTKTGSFDQDKIRETLTPSRPTASWDTTRSIRRPTCRSG